MTTTVVSQTSNSGFLSGGGSIEGMFGVSNTAAPQKVTILGDIHPDLTVKPTAAAPGTGFNTQYRFASGTTGQSSRQGTTSWSLGVTLTSDSKTTYGVPDVDSVSLDIKQSAGFTHDGTVARTYNTYAGTTASLSVTTGFADHVFLTSRRHNVYYDPVIGQTACPASSPQCASSERQPLVVSFSGPDELAHYDTDAGDLEWYQPVHEPGNVLSYP